MNLRRVTAIVLVVAAVALIAYDIYAIVAGGVDATLSRVTLSFSWKNPVIAYACGFVSGHLFWSQPTPTKEPVNGQV